MGITTPLLYNDTRATAFEASKPRAQALADLCLGALSDAALTADEVAKQVGESVLSIRPTMTRLFQAGNIAKTPLRRPNESGRMAVVWMLRDAA